LATAGVLEVRVTNSDRAGVRADKFGDHFGELQTQSHFDVRSGKFIPKIGSNPPIASY
jgi:hypothetical protein